MSLFLVDGREAFSGNTQVIDAHEIELITEEEETFIGITTRLTEHSINVYIDNKSTLRLGQSVNISLTTGHYYQRENDKTLRLFGTIIDVHQSQKNTEAFIFTIQILDYFGKKDDYIYALYNRIPSLPQRLTRQFWLGDL